MTPKKKKRRSSVVVIGNGPSTVRIYTMNRKDGYLSAFIATGGGVNELPLSCRG